jgi:hypothetical protein
MHIRRTADIIMKDLDLNKSAKLFPDRNAAFKGVPYCVTKITKI